MNDPISLEVEVSEIVDVAERIKRISLVPMSSSTVPAFSAGAHIVVAINDGRQICHNAYSLMGSLFDNRSYQISVLNTENSRGGSRYLHEFLRSGMRLVVSHPVNRFPLARLGRRHIFIAGGIGITPFLSMMQELDLRTIPFELHYSVRSLGRGAYVKEVSKAYGERVRIYETRNAERMSIYSVLSQQPLGTHLYACGPERMIELVMSSARKAGWPTEHLHVERFLGVSGGSAFTVKLVKSNRTIQVRENESLLEAVEAAGVKAPFQCRGGSCGACETRVVGCEGELIHNDYYLRADERKAGSKIMICVSRSKGATLILDL